MCLMPSREHSAGHIADVNQHSDVTAAGTPNRHIHPATGASAAAAASIFLTNTASNHLLERSFVMVKIYLNHQEKWGVVPPDPHEGG
jgi:hypothetical protein